MMTQLEGVAKGQAGFFLLCCNMGQAKCVKHSDTGKSMDMLYKQAAEAIREEPRLRVTTFCIDQIACTSASREKGAMFK